MAEIIANGIRTHVQHLGSGERTVVFIHGIVVDNLASLYFTLANPVAQMSAALLYDLRGHGKTERPPDGYDLDTLLCDLEGVLDAEDLDKPVTLLGHSFGGLIALAFAHKHPERVSALVLIDPPLPLEGWGEKIASIFGITGEERDRKIRETYDAMHGAAETRKRKRLAKTAEALVNETSLLSDLRRSRSFTESELEEIHCPVLAVYGDASEIIDCAEQMRKLLPEIDVHIFGGCTHLVLFEATGKIRDTVVEWLEKRS
jgi:pimeloyl-ACP methyl ester carboxylesterase